ncbi:hypothetical protein FM110_10265 [Brachybacterium nesterenkovii]|uniref:Uncharacterized protein n=1 Tax=Brachybacterium nesterenkovii TaxID=47847 RepID=A0A1X6X476_9MICO|nr:hypothetical protein FM110_10265 [Brachybacterium nesterenkovii]
MMRGDPGDGPISVSWAATGSSGSVLEPTSPRESHAVAQRSA